MNLATLAATTLNVLTPYLVKAGEKLVEEIGGASPNMPGICQIGGKHSGQYCHQQ
jgi:hypothetical protein